MNFSVFFANPGGSGMMIPVKVLHPQDPCAVYDEDGNRYLVCTAREVVWLRAHLTKLLILRTR